ncbi:hypothetical protein MRX96_039389 [Rhipicephalus microplus]
MDQPAHIWALLLPMVRPDVTREATPPPVISAGSSRCPQICGIGVWHCLSRPSDVASRIECNNVNPGSQRAATPASNNARFAWPTYIKGEEKGSWEAGEPPPPWVNRRCSIAEGAVRVDDRQPTLATAPASTHTHGHLART